MYVSCAKAATSGLIKNWKIIPGPLLSVFLFSLAISMFGGMGYASGFLIGIVQIILISYFYVWLDETVSNNRLSFKDMIEFDSGMFFRVLNILFILFIVSFLFLGIRINN